MARFYKIQTCLMFVATFLISSCFGNPAPPAPSLPPFSIMALTWNVGNTTVKDKIVAGLAEEIESLGKPDVLIVGTQEEMAKNGEELKDKLLQQFGKQSYMIAAQNSYTTAAGSNNSNKTLAFVVVQKTPISKTLNLPQNRSTLAVFVKKGMTLTNIRKRIDYPPGQKKSNNAFILIEGDLNREGVPHSLPISVANVHLNSFYDKSRRSHAVYFFDNQKFTNTNKSYEEIFEEAKRFHLIMGDFNERDYLMKDKTVSDRGYLTNFPAYGYDYSAKQERAIPVYGTYGFTTLGNKMSAALSDPRGRKNNAKGGHLDQIVITSGRAIEAPPAHYGPVISDEGEFKLTSKKKLFYAGSDHLPVLRSFSIAMGSDEGADAQTIVRNYITRRLPDFSKEIADLEFLLGGETVQDIQSRADKLIFYDDKGSSEDFLKQLCDLKSLTTSVRAKILWKKKSLEDLQGKIRLLKAKIESSDDQQFLATAYNKITLCNKNRSYALEQIDSSQAVIQWYIPHALSQDNFADYKKAVDDLAANHILAESGLGETERTSKKKGKLQSLLALRKKSSV